jgi:hypothetical protein
MPGRSSWPVAASVLAVIALGVTAGCGTTGAQPGAGRQGAGSTAAPGPPMTFCGTTRTAAGVPVRIEVDQGSAACPDALAVERDYARALASGKVPGNGGGAPATIRGWVCRGFATPEVLATGHTSTCQKGSAHILAVLRMPAPPTSSP